MIDVHFHCLPFIDDGPDEWDEAVELCQRAGEEGTEAIVATPHVLRDPWINDDPLARDEMVMKLNTLLGGKPAILPGCEFFYSSDALELWEKKDRSPLTGLNRNGYLLVEFPSVLVPSTAETVFHEFVVQGVHPVIAHPERNLVFVQEPEKLERLIELGALVQITAGSFLGEFGPRALEAAEVVRRPRPGAPRRLRRTQPPQAPPAPPRRTRPHRPPVGRRRRRAAVHPESARNRPICYGVSGRLSFRFAMD